MLFCGQEEPQYDQKSVTEEEDLDISKFPIKISANLSEFQIHMMMVLLIIWCLAVSAYTSLWNICQ